MLLPPPPREEVVRLDQREAVPPRERLGRRPVQQRVALRRGDVEVYVWACIAVGLLALVATAVLRARRGLGPFLAPPPPPPPPTPLPHLSGPGSGRAPDQVLVPVFQQGAGQLDGVPDAAQPRDADAALGVARGTRHHDARLELVDAVAREHGPVAGVVQRVVLEERHRVRRGRERRGVLSAAAAFSVLAF